METRPPPLFAEYAPLRRVAVCRPVYLALGEPINVIQAAHLARGVAVVAEGAAAEHARLVAALRAGGAAIVEIGPDPRFPYQLNTRDAGLGTPGGLVVGRFRRPIRRGEELLARDAAVAAGLAIRGTVAGGAFEGGDVVALDPVRAAVGLGARTEPAALAELGELLGPQVELIGVPFEERYLHLDMIFSVVAERLALACSAALPADFLATLQRADFRLLEVSEEEVFGHGCNVLALGPGRVLSHAANGRLNRLLRAEGFEVVEIDVTELAKSGGGPRCLTLPLERG